MKNWLKQLVNGMGIGIGVGVMFVLCYIGAWILLFDDSNNYENLVEIDDNLDLHPDVSMSDQDAMNILTGHWYGSTWNEDKDELYTYDWYGNDDGTYHLNFNYINKRSSTGMNACDGIWWIKQPYFYTKCEHDQENTYKILYLSDDYIVYQLLISNSQPVLRKTIYVKQRVSDLKEKMGDEEE